jgi:hypothetical protein
MAKAGQRKCMSCGEFFVPDHRKGERSSTAALSIAGARARPPARPPGWPGRPTTTTSAAPCTWQGCKRGAQRIRATAAEGFGRRGRYKISWRRKCLMQLRNVPIVLGLPRRPRPRRYKIS